MSTDVGANRLRGAMDSPQPGDTMRRGHGEAWGWAVDTGGVIERVVVTVSPVGAAGRVGEARPDVAAGIPDLPGGAQSGWRVPLDLSAVVGDAAEITAHVEDASGERRVLASAQVLLPPLAGRLGAARLHSWFETPANGSAVPGGRVTVSGWAFDAEDPVRAIVVSVDGLPMRLARTGGARPDVAELHPGVGAAAVSGWSTDITVAPGRATEVVITATALSASGRAPAAGSARVRVEPIPELFLDQPASGARVARAPIRVWGRALLPSGPADAVEMTLDGRPVGRARIGTQRLELADHNDPRAVLCGFETIVDFGGCAPGADTASLGAVAVGRDGQRVEFPPVTVRLGSAPGRFKDDGAAARLRKRFPAGVAGTARSLRSTTRVLVMTHDLRYGGAQLYLVELLRRLVAAGEVSATVVSPEDGPLGDRFEAIGVPVHIGGRTPVDTIAGYEGALAELGAWVQSQGFDTVLANTVLTFPGVDLARRIGLPCVWAIHEGVELPFYWTLVYPPGYFHPYVRERAESGLAEAAAVVFVADATRAQYLKWGQPNRYVTIPYGIDLAEVDAVRSSGSRSSGRHRLGITAEGPLILCVGSVESRKGQAALTSAFADISAEHPSAQLAIVGDAPSDYSRALHTYVRRARLDRRVHLVATTPDPYEWYAVADLFVCASDLESLPRTALEAMAFEVPVLSTDVSGMAEIIEDGRTGWLCAQRDIGSLRTALSRVLGLPATERHRVAEAARELVAGRHDSAGYSAAMGRLLAGLSEHPDALPGDLLS